MTESRKKSIKFLTEAPLSWQIRRWGTNGGIVEAPKSDHQERGPESLPGAFFRRFGTVYVLFWKYKSRTPLIDPLIPSKSRDFG